jgi:hypothetical protein
MVEKSIVQVKGVSMYPEQWTLLQQLGKELGLNNVSAAMRWIIAEWQRLKRTELLGDGRIEKLVTAWLDETISAEEAMEAISSQVADHRLDTARA